MFVRCLNVPNIDLRKLKLAIAVHGLSSANFFTCAWSSCGKWLSPLASTINCECARTERIEITWCVLAWLRLGADGTSVFGSVGFSSSLICTSMRSLYTPSVVVAVVATSLCYRQETADLILICGDTTTTATTAATFTDRWCWAHLSDAHRSFATSAEAKRLSWLVSDAGQCTVRH